MKYSTRIRPISYLKANAAEVFRELTELREPLVITQNGEAKAVIQDVASFEETQETLGPAQDSRARQPADRSGEDGSGRARHPTPPR